MLQQWQAQGRGMGVQTSDLPPLPTPDQWIFFSPLAQQQWRRRVSECGGRGADWLPTPEQWILLPFIWFQFRRRVREGEGGGSGLPLYQTVTAFFTASLTPSFCNDRLLNMKYWIFTSLKWFLVYQGCGVGTSPLPSPIKRFLDSPLHKNCQYIIYEPCNC